MTAAKGPVIWIVEDDPVTQRIIAENLSAHGFQPQLFDTAEKAYAALHHKMKPSLIILDMLLPGMSGVDLIRLLKQTKEWGSIPVVVVSVLSRDDAPQAGQDVSSAYWVNKPFDASHLIQTIQGILSSVR